jgi:L-rhamnose mutarotase
MERVCFLLKVKADRLPEYRARHQTVWADMRQALTETGWHNYSLFLRDDGLLVGYLETHDFNQALAQMAQLEVNARWQAPWENSSNSSKAAAPTKACSASKKSST